MLRLVFRQLETYGWRQEGRGLTFDVKAQYPKIQSIFLFKSIRTCYSGKVFSKVNIWERKRGEKGKMSAPMIGVAVIAS